MVERRKEARGTPGFFRLVFSWLSVTAPVALFVALEFVATSSSLLTGLRKATSVSMLRVQTVIHRSVELVIAMEPRTYANKPTTIEVLRTVVARGTAAVWRIVVIPIRALRLWANADADLGLCCGNRYDHCEGCNYRQRQNPVSIHNYTSLAQMPSSEV
jgi:hypothetical protein